jgi:multidrug efflux pump subunit AcrA (membrane-fusion protein)
MNLRPRLLILLALTGTLAACGKSPGGAAATGGAATAQAQALLLAPEDVQTLGKAEFTSGPVITGSIQPEKRADLRAEVQAVVLQVYKENGERVKRGDLLVRLDDSALRESLSSAEQGSAQPTRASSRPSANSSA